MMPAPQSLAARAEALLNRLAQVEAHEADYQARTDIETARRRASRSRVALDDALRVIPGLAESGIAPSPVGATAADDLARARTALRSAATSIVGAAVSDVASRIRSQSVNNALETADRVTRSLVVGLNRSADRKRQQILPDRINDPIVAYPGASDALAVRLRRIQSLLQRRVEGLEPDDLVQRWRDVADGVALWAAERQQLEAGLDGQHPDVREFLRQAATDEGAPWRLITPAVQAWLADPENTVNLRVVLRS